MERANEVTLGCAACTTSRSGLSTERSRRGRGWHAKGRTLTALPNRRLEAKRW